MLADFNHDGWKDILHVNGHVAPFLLDGEYAETYYETPSFYLNTGGGKFRDALKEAGPDMQVPLCSRGAAFGDIDNDGDTDVVIVNSAGPMRLLVNEVGQSRPWLGLRLVGADGKRDQLGARVGVLRRGAKTLWRRVTTGGSYASSSDPRLLFGLGDSSEVEAVQVEWPDGKVERFTGVESGRYSTLRQGTGSPGSSPGAGSP
jgi:hypothetical protein